MSKWLGFRSTWFPVKFDKLGTSQIISRREFFDPEAFREKINSSWISTTAKCTHWLQSFLRFSYNDLKLTKPCSTLLWKCAEGAYNYVFFIFPRYSITILCRAHCMWIGLASRDVLGYFHIWRIASGNVWTTEHSISGGKFLKLLLSSSASVKSQNKCE